MLNFKFKSIFVLFRCTERYSLCKGAQMIKVKDVVCKCGRKILDISYKVCDVLILIIYLTTHIIYRDTIIFL